MRNLKKILLAGTLVLALCVTAQATRTYLKNQTPIREKKTSRMIPREKGIQKGPYLIYPGKPDSMTVLWQLDAPSSCTLSWRTESSSESQSVYIPTYVNDFQYQHTFTGLAPAQRYVYELQAGDQKVSGSFRSAPEDNATSVKFLVYGDTRANVARHDKVAAGILKVLEREPDYQTFLLHSGDLVDHGDEEKLWSEQFFGQEWDNLKAIQARLPIHATRGNHERDGVLFRKYWPYPYCPSGQSFGSFDYGPLHVTVLDQFEDNYEYDPRKIGEAQMEWLRRDLATTSKAWKIILLHKPGWSTGQHGNCESVQEQIQPLCREFGVAAVFSAHNHCYARAEVDGVQHITTAGGGASLCEVNPRTDSWPYLKVAIPRRHFCKVAIDENGFHLEAVEPDGKVLDTFTLPTPPHPSPYKD